MKLQIVLLCTFITLFLTFGPSKVLAAPASPPQTSPADSSTVTTTKMVWQAPSYSLYTDGSPYLIQVDEENSFGSPYRNTYLSNTSYTPTLSYGLWYWRVKAKDSSGTWSDWSNVWSFTLAATLPSPTPTPSPSPSPTPSPIAASTPTQTFSVSNLPSSINSSDPYTITLQLANFTANTQYYLKGAFQKSGSSNYFGQTRVGDSWIKNNQTYSSQLPITTDSSGNWSGNLEVKVDPEDSGFTGSDSYIFKVARYSGTGSISWSSEQTVSLTDSSTSTSSLSSSTALETSGSPSPSPIPSASGDSSTKLQAVAQSADLHYSSFTLPTLSSNSATVAGIAVENTPEVKVKSSKIALIPTLFGVVLVAGSGVFLAFKHFSLAFFKKLP
ncbi:hypothetical protein A2631_03175 [Candidatus Daviesbacteria bacterium RIFCSPHIGHO2_01_FULL_44_29]|uniref:Fibronectin type-III domain-containing protein n=1 Tax=Candidatus Daviesbacteria bacterium RIFCSPHIGHO2_02_FULL_43_12 TaxID=1797776 RepID=A0A1F5KKC7_9BACT|nr:MAG: hypothetical protein A2631_03175 [Candidatus Daviesbacteria bacterium RIFCSPHIGHO2_01_FULL_44_29]OGE40764.1 MAG: hypothetical protein A3E86_02170 [Candidatus Daviesbacteria bacterium RIFCSPHIGHO2_12_FULL_47_45]OGE41386.1 MAG: hypothetical protein A3D25_02570 [Candidatus Daviesbacteria bacterium RIFCSPHIGHO2_02_FULL_43_12]OGE69587.1 MAG: hypothetical protein A3B55_04315 [Candidatus Daviesbacteria bacterium RIFCSPLOWO2_01_FULL_43_15]